MGQDRSVSVTFLQSYMAPVCEGEGGGRTGRGGGAGGGDSVCTNRTVASKPPLSTA